MLENDLREMFEWQAAADQPTAQISFPVAGRRAQVRRRWQRAAKLGAPIVAALAALAIGLTASLVSGAAGSQARPASPVVAPQRFNPLVPYAAARWLPYRIGEVLGYGYSTALRLIVVGDPAGPNWATIMVYAAHQCVLTSSRLSCGTTANGTRGLMTISGRAPDVGRDAAYWISRVAGDMDIPPGVTMVAFRYSTRAWAVVESTGKPADVIKIAANLRFGQTSHLRLPVRLTDLPPSWRNLRQLEFPDSKPQMSWTLTLTKRPVPWGNDPRDALTLAVTVGKGLVPACIRHSPYYHCQVTTIDGDRVFLTTLPAVSGQPFDYRLNAPNVDGLSVEIDVTGPDAPLSPAEFFAHHLKLLGPNSANWTTQPVG